MSFQYSDEDDTAELHLRVEMDDGSWWEVPAKIIASSRASSIVNVITSNEDLEKFLNLFQETIKSEEMLIDWAEERMTWEEVSSFARLVRPPRDTHYQSNWKNGAKQVVREDV